MVLGRHLSTILKEDTRCLATHHPYKKWTEKEIASSHAFQHQLCQGNHWVVYTLLSDSGISKSNKDPAEGENKSPVYTFHYSNNENENV